MGRERSSAPGDRSGRGATGGRRRRRWWRWPLRALLLLALLGALLWFWRDPVARRFALPLAARRARALLGLELSVDSIAIAPAASEVSLHGVRLEGGDPTSGLLSFRARQVRVSFSPLALLLGRDDAIALVRVEGLEARVDLDREPLLPRGDSRARPRGRHARAWPRLVRIAGGSLRLESRRRGPLELDGVELSLWRGRELRARVARASGPGGGRWLREVPLPVDVRARDRSAEAGTFRDVLVEELLGGGRLLARGLMVERDRAGRVRAQGELPFLPGRLEQWTLAPGSLAAHLRFEELDVARARRFLRPSLATLEGRLAGRVAIDVPLGSPEPWRARIDLDLDGGAWPERELALSRGSVRGALAGGGDLDLRVTVDELRQGRWPPVDGGFSLRRTKGESGSEWRIEEVEARAAGGRLRGGARLRSSEEGLLVEGSDARVEGVSLAAFSSFAPPLAALGGRASGEVSLSGGPRLEDLVVAGRLRLQGARVRGEPASLRLAGRLAGCGVRIDDGVFSRGTDGARFSVAIEEEAGEVVVDRISLAGRLAGRPLALTRAPRARLRPDGSLDVSPFVLEAAGGRWRAAFGRERSGGWRFEVALDDLEVSAAALGALEPELAASLAEWGLEARLGGRATGRLEPGATGELEPRIDARLRLAGGRVHPPGQAERPLEGEARVVVEPDRLRVRDLLLRSGEESIEGSGEVGLERDRAGRLAPAGAASVDLSGRLASLASLARLEGSAFREVEGEVEFTLRGEGEIDPIAGLVEPRLEGEARLRGGRVRFRGEIPTLDEVEGALALRGDEVRVESLTGRLGGSLVLLTGRVFTAPPWSGGGLAVRGVDLHLLAARALLVREPELRVRGDVDLEWVGPWSGPELRGVVRVTRAWWLRDVALTGVGGPAMPFDLFHLEKPPLSGTRLDVAVRAPRSIVLRDNVVRSRASADLRLRGTGRDPFLSGIVSTDEGRVRFGNTFLDVKSALVEFEEGDPFHPRLEITLGREIRGYRVTVRVTGTLDEPEVHLDSSPPLAREKLLVLVTTGRRIEDIEEEGVGRFAAVEAAKYAGKNLLAYLFRGGDPTEESFLDRLTVDVESPEQRGLEDLIRVKYRVEEKLLGKWGEIFVQSERDQYGEYNFDLGWRLEVK